MAGPYKPVGVDDDELFPPRVEARFARDFGARSGEVTFSYTDNLELATGEHRLYNNSGAARTIQNVRAAVGGAPTGNAAVIDVHKNGTTIFTTQGDRPSIASGEFVSAKKVPQVVAWEDGEYLTVDIDSVGSSSPGRSLTVQIEFR